MAVAVLVAGLCLLYVVQDTILGDLTARRERAQDALLQIKEVNRSIELQIEQTFSLERLSRIARSKLGMVEPSVVYYVPLQQSERH
jgi:cell division protein FtsB